MKSVASSFIGLLFLVFALDARADVDLGLYRKAQETKAAKDMISGYVTGVGRGLFWYNAAAGARNSSQLFCMPSKLSLDQGLVESLLDQEIRSPASGNAYKDDTPIEFILLRAFETRFPCDEA